MRSNFYDILPEVISKINQLKNQSNDALIKSDGTPAGIADYTVVASNYQIIKPLCETLVRQFSLLREDYHNGEINLVRYKEYLLQLKEFLPAIKDEIYLKNLINVQMIESEICKYL